MQVRNANGLTDLTLEETTIIIIGDPGTGSYHKTTLADFLAVVKKEIVPFEAVDTYVIALTPERKLRFGDALNIKVEAVTEDGGIREIPFELITDQLPDTTSYTLNFGTPTTGRIKIS